MIHLLAEFVVLGVRVHPVTAEELTAHVVGAVNDRARAVIAHQNLHGAHLSRVDASVRQLNAVADVVHIDGMPLVWFGRLLGYPFRTAHRVTYVDWLPSLLQAAASNRWRVFYLGSEPGVAERGAAHFRAENPSLEIRTRHGYFDASTSSVENQSVIAEIADYRPDVLLVGMGMPRQEQWIVRNLESLQAHAVLPCGAAMDYFAEAVALPPRWAGRLGIEWFFRLLGEPRRLGFRYLVEPWFLLPTAFAELISRLAGRRNSTQASAEAHSSSPASKTRPSDATV